MAGEKICESCGKPYSGAECATCLESRVALPPSLPFVSFIVVLFLIIGFTVTRIAVSAYKAREHSIAVHWQERGAEALRTGRAADAVECFEDALVYDNENSSYRLQLATALERAGRYDEARSHLLSLWEARPGDANVNLQLARLESRRGNITAAARYYEGAIYGVWPQGIDPYKSRSDTRLEFAQLLITAKRRDEAQAQLTALANEVPPSSPVHKAIGDLLMEAGAPGQAYEQYLLPRVGSKRMTSVQQLDLAQAAFAQNDFALANRWAQQASREAPPTPGAQEFAARTEAIVSSDPYAKGIGELERALRVIKAFNTADARMGQCFPSYSLGPNTRTAVQQLAAQSDNAQAPQGGLSGTSQTQVQNFSSWAQGLRPRMIASKLRHEDDVQEVAMRFVFQTEQFAAKNCSVNPSPEDSALLSLSRQRWSNE